MKFKVKSCEEVFENFMVPTGEGGRRRQLEYGYKILLKPCSWSNSLGIFDLGNIEIIFDHPILVGEEIEL